MFGRQKVWSWGLRRVVDEGARAEKGISVFGFVGVPADGADLLGRVRRRLPVSRAVGLFDGRGDDGDATGSEREDTWKLTEADG